jgi:hypothetical protein
MKSRFLVIACLVFLFSGGGSAQNIIKSLERSVPGEGRVTVHQDASIEALLGTERSVAVSGEQSIIKVQGYRIQAYAGNNTRQAKSDAYTIASQIRTYFPELPVYTSFNPPRWLCRVGDFRSIEEADAMMRKLRTTGVFKEVSIVKDIVNIPL